MSSALLSMGSNLGDREAILAAAIDGLGDRVCAVSSVYRNPPWGPIPQDDYDNLVVRVRDEHTDAWGWLTRGLALEQRAGRQRSVRWGPRTLDVDVIVVDEQRRHDDRLTLPHPRAHERGFVLVPWVEIEPAAVLPGYGPIADLLAALPPEATATIVATGRIPGTPGPPGSGSGSGGS